MEIYILENVHAKPYRTKIKTYRPMWVGGRRFITKLVRLKAENRVAVDAYIFLVPIGRAHPIGIHFLVPIGRARPIGMNFFDTV